MENRWSKTMSKIDIIVKSNFDARYLIIRFGDFSLDFTERVTYSSDVRYLTRS